jgi:hypothetical protein
VYIWPGSPHCRAPRVDSGGCHRRPFLALPLPEPKCWNNLTMSRMTATRQLAFLFLSSSCWISKLEWRRLPMASPDGRLLVSTSDDCTVCSFDEMVRAWEVLEVPRMLMAHSEPINVVDFDRKCAMTVSESYHIYPEVYYHSSFLYSIYTDSEAQCNTSHNYTQTILHTLHHIRFRSSNSSTGFDRTTPGDRSRLHRGQTLRFAIDPIDLVEVVAFTLSCSSRLEVPTC